jgi:hypothetical protein
MIDSGLHSIAGLMLTTSALTPMTGSPGGTAL